MSFILDALKKSEIERQRQAMPGLVESGVARPRSRLPVWAIALAGLLAVNLLVLFVMLARGWMAAPAARPAAIARGAAAPPAPKTEPFSPLDSAPVYAPEIPVSGNSSGAAPPPAAGVRPQRAVPPVDEGGDSARAAHRPDPVLAEEGSKSGDGEVLPSISEISLSGDQALPELHLDVHVYATKASDRFVYINMRKYREGATLQEGPTVERIRRDGVILNYQGLRFLLPRQ